LQIVKSDTNTGCSGTSPTIDVVFGIDGSYSMQDIMDTVADVVENVTVTFSAVPGSRFALFLYTDTEEELSWGFHLTNSLTLEELKDKIRDHAWWEGNYGDSHVLAIQTAKTELQSNKRPGISSNIVVITDSEIDPEDKVVADVSKAVTSEGFNVFVVGIVSKEVPFIPENLALIAGGNKNRVFKPEEKVRLNTALCYT